jgi:hypothetical protein
MMRRGVTEDSVAPVRLDGLMPSSVAWGRGLSPPIHSHTASKLRLQSRKQPHDA